METNTTDIHSHLVQRAQEKDQSAQFELYKLYSKAMLNVANRIVGDLAEAEDMLQESFVSAFNNIHNYRGEATFGSWLKRIVVNKSINAIKKRKLDLVEMSDHDIGEDVIEKNEDLKLEVSMIKKSMELLPNGFRMVLSLYLLEGYDHREIGEIMGISESTSKSQYNRAKKKMRIIMKERYGYEG